MSEDGGAQNPAAWLIEQAGYKDVHDNKTRMATWPTQHSCRQRTCRKSTADLLKFRDEITQAVQSLRHYLVQEPELLP
ncbi:hypothetical protein IPL68_01515 [Candidatus Saccharibacteria bacterium]|nr:MAG: hypothetical protein IPL68_01515 [Candidatus Saccharibacteria bacterium]